MDTKQETLQDQLTEAPSSEQTSKTPNSGDDKPKNRRGHRKRQWSFPTISRCPRCGSDNTIATRTDTKKGWQYRLCRQAVCRKSYPVKGEKV